VHLHLDRLETTSAADDSLADKVAGYLALRAILRTQFILQVYPPSQHLSAAGTTHIEVITMQILLLSGFTSPQSSQELHDILLIPLTAPLPMTRVTGRGHIEDRV